MMVADTMIDHVAHTLGIEPEEVRKRNLYQFDDFTAYNMPINVKLRVRLRFLIVNKIFFGLTAGSQLGNMGAL